MHGSAVQCPYPLQNSSQYLKNAIPPQQETYDLIEEDYDEGRQRKGNPLKPSKKDKALLRIRKKL